MSLRLSVLASGSKGNCIYVGSETTHILVDAGLSGKETMRRLEMIGLDPACLSAICVTHEHDDHRASLGILHRRHQLELYANAGTVEAVERSARFKGLKWNVFTTGVAFQIGDLVLEPFSVPHDSYEPVGFVISQGACCVGVVTDMGIATELIRERLRRCEAVVIEANHDEELLKDADRPWSLKQRIAGRQGHLSNSQAAELLCEICGEQLRAVFLAHLSADCNRPELALRTVRKRLDGAGWSHVAVHLTSPVDPTIVYVTQAAPVEVC